MTAHTTGFRTEHRAGHTRGWGAALLVMLVALAPLAASVPSAAAAAVDAGGGKLLLVLDSSGSMKEPAAGGQTKIAAARQALNTVVGHLPGSAVVGLRVYGGKVSSGPRACTDSELVVPLGQHNTSGLRQAIAAYRPLGETPIAYSLRKAAADVGTEGRRSIVLVSDGEETCGQDPCAAAREIARAGIDLKVDVVGFRVDAKARQQLQCIAAAGRGTYYDADDADDLAAGLDRLSTRAFRPFRVTGKPVTGTLSAVGAPVLTAGQYVDTAPVGDTTKHYLLDRTIPGSDLHVGVSSQLPAGRKVADIDLTILTADGQTCGWGTSFENSLLGMSSLFTGSASSVTASAFADECRNADQLVLTLKLGTVSEELDNAPMEIGVYEEPPVGNVSALPGPAPDKPTWAPMSLAAAPRTVTAGAGFSDAPRVEPGTYRGTVLPGEVQFYKVHVDWGQRLQAELRIPPVSGALADAVDFQHALNIMVVNPTRADAHSVFTTDVPGVGSGTLLIDKQGEEVSGVTTLEVRYRNRERSTDMERAAAIPGDYYVVVTMARDRDDQSYLLPYHLLLGVEGTAGEGAPGYAGGKEIIGPAAATAPTDGGDTASPAAPAPELSPTAADGDSGRSRSTVVALAAGGATLIVLGAVGVWVLWRTWAVRP